MTKKDENILKKGLLKPGADFTSNVMHEVQDEEKALNAVLSQHGRINAPADFTVRVLDQLEEKTSVTIYTPVISKSVWTGIAVTAFLVVILSLFAEKMNSSKFDTNENVGDLIRHLEPFFTSSSALIYLLFGVLLFSVGLLIEQRINSLKNLKSE